MNETRIFTIRLDKATFSELERIAKATERSKAAVLRYLLRKELAERANHQEVKHVSTHG
jgi:predicted transcriptional regulator